MRTLPASLAAALAGTNSTNLVKLMAIERKDGVTQRFALAQADMTISGLGTFTAEPGLYCGSFTITANQASGVLPVEVSAYEGGAIDLSDLMRGLYDDARLQLYIADHSDEGRGAVRVFVGWIGSVAMGSEGAARFEARGLLSKTQFLVTEHYTPTCRAWFGDRRCKVPVYPDDIIRSTEYEAGAVVRVRQADNGNPSDYGNLIWRCITAGTTAETQPDYTGSVGTEVDDGSARFKAENALLRHAQVVSVSGFDITLENVATPIHPFDLGMIIARSGKNAGRSIEIREWNAGTLTATCYLEPPLVFEAGDWVEILPGCNYTPGANGCARYANIINFRGEPFVPGEDAVNIDYTTWGA